MAHELVEAPGLRKAANGLIEVGNKVDVGDDHWENGVAFTPRGCMSIYAHAPYCPSEDKSQFWECKAPVTIIPYLLEIGLVWSLVDMGADPKAILTEAFDVGSSAVLERLAWEGIADTAAATPLPFPTPSGTIATGGIVGRVMGSAVAPPTLTGTALSVGNAATGGAAIGLVEAKMIDASDHIGSAGTIFVSPAVVATADTAVERIGGELRTRATESLIVVGNFDTDRVIGVIGEVDVYLGEIINLEVSHRVKNEWVGRAERRALAVWNPCGVYSATIGAP